MKKYILSAAVALTATVALAASINITKVNKTISDVLKQEVTEFIPQLSIAFDEDTNLELENLQNTVAGVKASAVAMNSKWSDAPSSIDLALRVKNLKLEETNSHVEFSGSMGSKTDAVALYRFIGASLVEIETETETDLDKEFLAWAQAVAQTQKLEEIAPQLETLVVLIKKALLEDSKEDDSVDMKKWAQLMDSLVVDTQIQNYQTIGVMLKTTKTVEFDDVVVSNLSLNITKDGITFTGRMSLDVENGYVEMITAMLGNYLTAVEHADAETMEDLRSMARSYIEMAEYLLKK